MEKKKKFPRTKIFLGMTCLALGGWGVYSSGFAQEPALLRGRGQRALVHLDRDQTVQGLLAGLPHSREAAPGQRTPFAYTRDVGRG